MTQDRHARSRPWHNPFEVRLRGPLNRSPNRTAPTRRHEKTVVKALDYRETLTLHDTVR